MVFLVFLCEIIAQDTITDEEYYNIAIKPTKVAFYSAVLPGLGQAHNRDYWKIPIVYGALGASIYSYDFNNVRFHKYREAYKLLKMGLENEYPGISASTLEKAQRYHKRYRDLSLLVTSGLYILQIVEASVDAHLQYHDTDSKLSVNPSFILPLGDNDEIALGISIKYNF